MISETALPINSVTQAGQIHQGDALEVLRTLPSASVHCIVTSPPYWGLRRYNTGSSQEIGQEATVQEWVDRLVVVFREVRRVLRDDGTLWLNVGDAWGGSRQGGSYTGKQSSNLGSLWVQESGLSCPPQYDADMAGQLFGLPWRLAFALQADGWTLRSEIIWAKQAPMPESLDGWRWERCHKRRWSLKSTTPELHRHVQYQRDFGQPVVSDCPGCPRCTPNDGWVLRHGSWRPTEAHESLFLLTKGMGYYGDKQAVAEQLQESMGNEPMGERCSGRNPRNVQKFPAEPQIMDFCLSCGTWFGKNGHARRTIKRWTEMDGKERTARMVLHRRCPVCKVVDDFVNHFAAFPTSLPAWCIKASTSAGGVCSACGAPWARMVESTPMQIRRSDYKNGSGNRTASSGTMLAPAESRTLGWRPACACRPTEPIPATVLDPFLGTGSTLIAAVRLGRHGIGIDLNPRYVALAQRRLAMEAPQGNNAECLEKAQMEAQLPLG